MNVLLPLLWHPNHAKKKMFLSVKVGELANFCQFTKSIKMGGLFFIWLVKVL